MKALTIKQPWATLIMHYFLNDIPGLTDAEIRKVYL